MPTSTSSFLRGMFRLPPLGRPSKPNSPSRRKLPHRISCIPTRPRCCVPNEEDMDEPFSEAPDDDSDPKPQPPSKIISTTESVKPGEPVDPITLLPIGKYQFTFTRSSGQQIVYNVDTLVEYFVISGDFSEPTTRIPLTSQELETVDSVARAMDPSLPSVVKAKAELSYYKEQKVLVEQLEAIERCCAEVVGDLRRIVESAPSEAGHLELVSVLYPQFSDFFHQLRRLDPLSAEHALRQYVDMVNGPPNRPVQNKSKMKRQVVEFLNKHKQPTLGRGVTTFSGGRRASAPPAPTNIRLRFAHLSHSRTSCPSLPSIRTTRSNSTPAVVVPPTAPPPPLPSTTSTAGSSTPPPRTGGSGGGSGYPSPTPTITTLSASTSSTSTSSSSPRRYDVGGSRSPPPNCPNYIPIPPPLHIRPLSPPASHGIPPPLPPPLPLSSLTPDRAPYLSRDNYRISGPGSSVP